MHVCVYTHDQHLNSSHLNERSQVVVSKCLSVKIDQKSGKSQISIYVFTPYKYIHRKHACIYDTQHISYRSRGLCIILMPGLFIEKPNVFEWKITK